MKKTLWALALCGAVMLTACSNLKDPAAKALAGAESSLAAIRESAAQYAPSELQAVDAKVDALKKELATGNFKGVIAEAPSVTDAISKLGALVEEKKAAMTAAMESAKQDWQSLAADMPQMISAIQGRVDILSQSKRLPASVPQAAFDSAKTGLESLKSGWNEASTALASGDAVGAVAKAKSLKTQGEEILRALGMTAG